MSSPTFSITDLPSGLISQILSQLDIAGADDVALLTKCLQRFARQYARMRKRYELVPYAGDAHDMLDEAVSLTKRLLPLLTRLDFVDELRRGYRLVNEGIGKEGRGSLAAARKALEAFADAAAFAANNTDTKPARKKDEILFVCVEALMAILEQLTGNRAEVFRWELGRRRARFKSAEAKAIGLFFRHVDPALDEHRIATMIGQICDLRSGQLLGVAPFDPIAHMEAAGGFNLAFVSAQRHQSL